LIKSGQTELFDQLSGDIKKIDDQIGSLQDSIAGEAPEEFMGVVERETRDRIAALDATSKIFRSNSSSNRKTRRPRRTTIG
jgi:hypothetical protein